LFLRPRERRPLGKCKEHLKRERERTRERTGKRERERGSDKVTPPSRIGCERKSEDGARDERGEEGKRLANRGDGDGRWRGRFKEEEEEEEEEEVKMVQRRQLHHRSRR